MGGGPGAQECPSYPPPRLAGRRGDTGTSSHPPPPCLLFCQNPVSCLFSQYPLSCLFSQVHHPTHLHHISVPLMLTLHLQARVDSQEGAPAPPQWLKEGGPIKLIASPLSSKVQLLDIDPLRLPLVGCTLLLVRFSILSVSSFLPVLACLPSCHPEVHSRPPGDFEL